MSNEVYKTIFSMDMPKVNLERKARYSFGVVNEDGYIEDLALKQFIAHEANYREPGEYTQKCVISALISQISAFKDKMEFNTWCKTESRSFLDKVQKLVSMGAKFPKKGVVN